jgi:serine/threonine protein kinase
LVLKALSKQDNSTYVVIKVVLKCKSGSLQREKSIFEFLKSRDVRCPNIASYLRGFQTEHYECAVLEYYEGGDLFSKMEGGDLTRDETRRYAL